MRIQLSHDFFLDEFVPESIYNEFQEKSLWFLDEKIINVAQFLRDHFGRPVIINNWYHGGERQLSGFRPPDTEIGAKLSQHKFGRAIDIQIADIDPAEIRKTIKDNEHYFYQGGIRAVEMATPTWVHVDIRNSKKLLWIPY
ncbi:MAG: D-Ala-D-Ala carboxypeptidase family metallohydrolase [Candidatus Helarchaeota archaeon]